LFNITHKRMNNIKSTFSIKDLENLSGVKAHTIRIWEKRYNLLQPNRTDTNIRYYSLSSLQKLLNVSFLNSNGYKISKISKLKEQEIPDAVQKLVSEQSVKNRAINAFKLSMVNFDQSLFFETYNNLLKEQSFRDVFYDVFIPLLEEIGLLWQTDTITPSHEHFIAALIKQKILINTEKLQQTKPTNNSKTFVLYLPENEVHELGLMYLNYEILAQGYQSIFLGQSIPLENLHDLTGFYDNITYVCYCTVKPEKDIINNYLNECHRSILNENKAKLVVLGKMIHAIKKDKLPDSISTFSSIDEFVNTL